MANSEPTVFKNVCPLDRPDTCSMRVTVQDEVAIDLKGDAEHAFTRGFLCQKMARYLDRVYSPDRLMFPMKRVGAKGEGKFERISWEAALEAITTRFAAIAASPDGPQAILPHSYYGTMGKLQASSLDRRFFHRLGASKLGGGPTLAGITLERLQAEGSVRLNLPPDHAPFADGVFPTPSGKCELYSERMKAGGLDPLPTYIPPLEDPRTRPARAAKYPLQLLSPPRPQFLNSTFANSPKHRAAAGEPTIELATFDAQARGLSDGQWAHVFNDRGSFQARVSLTGSVRPGVAVATGIHWNKLSPGRSNVNGTTSSALTDMGGGATFFDNLVEIQSLSATLDD